MNKIGKLRYLERKPHQSELVFMQLLYPGRIRIWRCWFCGGRKTRKPAEKPSKQGKKQQQTQPTYDTKLELNPG